MLEPETLRVVPGKSAFLSAPVVPTFACPFQLEGIDHHAGAQAHPTAIAPATGSIAP